MVQSGGATEKTPVTPAGIDPGTVRLVAQCLKHYATPGPHIFIAGNIYYNAMNVMDQISSYIKMEVL